MSSLNSLIFVQNAKRVQEGKVSSNAFKVLLRNIAIMVMVIIPEHRLHKATQETHKSRNMLHTTSATSVHQTLCRCNMKSLLTSTTFLMCLFTTEGSGLVVIPEAQSSGTRGLLGVVGEVGCEDRSTKTWLKHLVNNQLHCKWHFSVLHIVAQVCIFSLWSMCIKRSWNIPVIWGCVVPSAVTAHKSHLLCNKDPKKAKPHRNIISKKNCTTES